MREEYFKILKDMRVDGWLVVAWTPEEVGDIQTDHIEDLLIERGNDIIEQLQGELK